VVSERFNYRVKRELIGFLYASGSYALAAQLAVILFIAWLVESAVPAPLWWSWLLGSAAALIWRILHLFWRRYHSSASRLRLEYEYFIGSTCSAIMWAMGLLFFMSYLPETQRMLLVLLSCLYIAACSVLLLNSARCFYGSIIPVGAALCLELSARGDDINQAIILVVLFCILFSELTRRQILRWQKAGLYNRFLSADMAKQLRKRSESLRMASQLDGLTAIANRGKFDEQLALQWRRCSRARAPLSLILLDVDYFKQFNDRYGHQAGDECLRQLAAILGGALRRDDDLAARYGGEEFVVLLPFTDVAGARRIAESINLAFQQLAIPHARSLVAEQVTCSQGCACVVPEPNTACSELVEMADVALYRAKKNGRNRIEIAD
jgi:diguanylate cyclase (GGDEF)-like protein